MKSCGATSRAGSSPTTRSTSMRSRSAASSGNPQARPLHAAVWQRSISMAYIVAGLTKGAHQARGLIRALADAGFPREEIDMAGGAIAALVEMGIPENEAHVFADRKSVV